MNEQIKEHLLKIMETQMEILLDMYQDRSPEDQCKAVLHDMGIEIPFDGASRGIINLHMNAVIKQEVIKQQWNALTTKIKEPETKKKFGLHKA